MTNAGLHKKEEQRGEPIHHVDAAPTCGC